jgi:hypothetical protein
MWPAADNMEGFFQNIKSDIATFASPGSIKEERARSNSIKIRWTAVRQIQKEATFTIDRNSKVNVSFDVSKTSLPYKEFLAHESMANVYLLATQIRNIIKPVENYITTKAKDDLEEENEGSIEHLILDSVCAPITEGDHLQEATRVIFLRGQAGSGKSVAMRMMAREQALKYIQGESEFIFFYIDAQGRALSRLDEAVAFELQKLFVGDIFYHTIHTLARNHIIVPIIDGFDELIGSGGFTDAFSSLSSFLSSLGRNGTVIATGRSTFYDDKKFSVIAENYSHDGTLNYKFDTIRLLGWGNEEINQYLTLRFGENVKFKREFLKLYESTIDYNKKLLEKPFYCVKLSDTLESTSYIFDKKVDLLDQLVNNLIDREVNKLKSKDGLNILNTEGHKWLLKQLSLELWWQEVRSVDRETLTAIAEMVAENFSLSPEYYKILDDRVGSHAFLTTDNQEDPSKRSFDNEIYYDFFLLEALADMVENNSSELKPFLSRSLLGESLLDSLEVKSTNWDVNKIIEWVTNIFNSLKKSTLGSLERKNGGALFASLIKGRNDLPEQMIISNIECYKRDLSNITLNNSKIENCYFQNIYLYNSKILNCTFTDTTLDRLFIDEETKFTETSLSPGKNIFSLVYNNINIYDPDELRGLLTRMGAVLPEKTKVKLTPDQRGLILLLEELIDKLTNKLYFDPEENTDRHFNRIYNNPSWDRLFKLLIECKIAEKKYIDRSGTRGYLYRLTVAYDDLLSSISAVGEAKDPRIRSFWEKI